MNNRIGVYPGTFDPITYGHLDIAERALHVVDTLIVGVALNQNKNSLFTVDERIRMVEKEISALPIAKGKKVIVKPLVETLLVNFAKENNADIIFRGLRAVSDFEYEFKMCVVNRRLEPKIETVFLMACEKHQFVSSVFVKEVCRLGGDISTFVSPEIATKLIKKYGEVNA